MKQRYDPFIKEHINSSEKDEQQNTKKAEKSVYVTSTSCTDLYNKCLRFLEHLRVIGNKNAGKSITSIKKVKKTNYESIRIQ